MGSAERTCLWDLSEQRGAGVILGTESSNLLFPVTLTEFQKDRNTDRQRKRANKVRAAREVMH
jgi:hypothetical protein